MPSNNSFTETTTQGWLSRIKGALTGLIIGPLMVILAVCLLCKRSDSGVIAHLWRGLRLSEHGNNITYRINAECPV